MTVNEQSISAEMLAQFKDRFNSNPQFRVAMNAVIKNGVRNTAINYKSAVDLPYVFSIDIANDKVTAQKQSGRCWIFAGLNVLRAQVADKCNLGHFELSQNHLMFWDKLEKANYFLENILATVDETVDSRLVSWLLTAPLNDGGQWEMFINLVEKYGVMPKDAMPETFHSSQSAVMNQLLTAKLRENAVALRRMHKQGLSASELTRHKTEMLNEFYRMTCHFLGEPPQQFDFEYRDKNKEYHRVSGLTPLQFAAQYTDGNLADYISVINAPTEDKPFGRTFTVKYLGNVQGGRPVIYLNLDNDELKQLTIAQMQAGEPVWFGCDVGKMSDRDGGHLDTALYDYAGALNGTFQMTKAERLDYRESCLTHAMVFVGVNLVDGKPNRWKVENSWGCDPGKDGIFVMSDPWFDEYMYQVVIHKKFLSEEQRKAFEQEPIELDPWDPMGALA